MEKLFSSVVFSILGDIKTIKYEKYGTGYVCHLHGSAIPCKLVDIKAS
jgi:hypothetical protein